MMELIAIAAIFRDGWVSSPPTSCHMKTKCCSPLEDTGSVVLCGAGVARLLRPWTPSLQKGGPVSFCPFINYLWYSVIVARHGLRPTTTHSSHLFFSPPGFLHFIPSPLLEAVSHQHARSKHSSFCFTSFLMQQSALLSSSLKLFLLLSLKSHSLSVGLSNGLLCSTTFKMLMYPRQHPHRLLKFLSTLPE